MPTAQATDATESTDTSDTKPVANDAKAGSRWRMFVDCILDVRNLFFSVAIMSAFLLISYEVLKDIRKQPIIIEELEIPSAIQQLGLTGTVSAQRLWDEMTRIHTATGSRKEQISLLSANRQLNIVEPTTGVSFQGVTQLIRRNFGPPQTRIAGEIICQSEPCGWDRTTMRLRVFEGENVRLIDAGPTFSEAPDELFREAALLIMEEVDPYIAAAFLYQLPDEQYKAIAMAKRMIQNDHPSSAWAAVFLGDTSFKLGNHEEALRYYKNSILIAQDMGMSDFFPPLLEEGKAYLALNKPTKAIAAFEAAAQADPTLAEPLIEKANAYAELGQYLKAANTYQDAAVLVTEHPEQSGHADVWVRWGRVVQQYVTENPRFECARAMHLVPPYFKQGGANVPSDVRQVLQLKLGVCQNQ